MQERRAMKRILILTAGFGDGHNAAARSLREAIELTTDAAKVEVLDLFESSYGVLNTLAKRAYLGMVHYAPTLWNGVFQVMDNPTLFRRQVNGMGKLRDRFHLSGLRPSDRRHLPGPRRTPLPAGDRGDGFDFGLFGLVPGLQRPLDRRQ